jgi:hypothetical protein
MHQVTGGASQTLALEAYWQSCGRPWNGLMSGKAGQNAAALSFVGRDQAWMSSALVLILLPSSSCIDTVMRKVPKSLQQPPTMFNHLTFSRLALSSFSLTPRTSHAPISAST